jgi:hypothetical protein
MRIHDLRITASIIFVSLAFAALGPTTATAEEIITGGGLNDLQFQALVDSASPGDTILCSPGLYQFTGPVRIDKSLRIVAESSSEPPVFEGTGVAPTPVETGNNGFLVYDLQSDIDGLEFAGLHMRHFDRPFAFDPGWGCPLAPGTLKNLTVADNYIENSRRGMQIWGGQTETFDFVDNTIDVHNIGVMVIRGPEVCSSRSARGTVARNSITAGFAGIIAIGVERTAVRDNWVTSGAVGVWFGDDAAQHVPVDSPVRVGSVANNTIESGDLGIILNGPTPIRASSALGNTVSSSFVGLLMEEGANGFLAANNEFSSSWTDIWLAGNFDGWTYPPASHDNTVVATDFQTTYADNGIDNHLVGTLAMIENPGVPPEVQQMLIDLRELLAERTP